MCTQVPMEGLELELQVIVNCPVWMLGLELEPMEEQQIHLNSESLHSQEL